MVTAIEDLYDSIINKNYSIRRINICANNIISKYDVHENEEEEQIDFFEDYLQNHLYHFRRKILTLLLH